MDPGTALIFACIVAWKIVYGGATAAADQGRAEARLAAAAIRDDLRQRRDAWAKSLGARLANGRSGGPSTALWWGWAAMRTARALRRALKRDPREAEPAIRGPVGPFRRVWDAARRGGRYAADEARRRRSAGEQQTRPLLGVCERCGAVVARASLAPATDASGAQEQLCANCRSRADRDPSAERVDVDRADDGPRDGARPQPAAARPQLGAPVPEVSEGDTREPEPEVRPAIAEPAPPQPATRQTPSTVQPASETPALEGDPMAPRPPGQVVPVRTPFPTAVAGGARRNGGESQTHGQWNRCTVDIRKRLEDLPALLEMMLHRLNTAEAGRSQVQGVLHTHEGIVAFTGQVEQMLTTVNRQEMPVLNAVEAAGGPDEIAGIPYLSDV